MTWPQLECLSKKTPASKWNIIPHKKEKKMFPQKKKKRKKEKKTEKEKKGLHADENLS